MLGASEEEVTLQISHRLLALGATSALLLAACSSSGSSTAPSAAAPSEAAPSAAASEAAPSAAASASAAPSSALNTDYTACVAFDTGGLGDKGFNDLAKKGLEDAKALGFQTAFSEAQGATDYESNIQRLLDQGCQSIITVGFLQSSATAKATLANPTIAFGQVDATWNSAGDDFTPGTADDPPPGVPANFTGLDYQVDQASMLAGYLAASFSKSGKVGTYGGLAFPGVTRFMDGLRRRPVPQPEEGHGRRGRRLGRFAPGSHHHRHVRRRQRWHRHLERSGQG